MRSCNNAHFQAEQSDEQLALQSLALRYRALVEDQKDAEDPNLVKQQQAEVHQRLTQAVTRAFEQRQAAQQELANQLKTRLAQLQDRLAQRRANRQQHIERAVEALLRGEPASVLGLVPSRHELAGRPQLRGLGFVLPGIGS